MEAAAPADGAGSEQAIPGQWGEAENADPGTEPNISADQKEPEPNPEPEELSPRERRKREKEQRELAKQEQRKKAEEKAPRRNSKVC